MFEIPLASVFRERDCVSRRASNKEREKGLPFLLAPEQGKNKERGGRERGGEREGRRGREGEFFSYPYLLYSTLNLTLFYSSLSCRILRYSYAILPNFYPSILCFRLFYSTRLDHTLSSPTPCPTLTPPCRTLTLL